MKKGRPGFPVEIIDTHTPAVHRFPSEAAAAVEILGSYGKRNYINQAVTVRGIGEVPFTNGRYIARRIK
jgi:hypothetical protein